MAAWAWAMFEAAFDRPPRALYERLGPPHDGVASLYSATLGAGACAWVGVVAATEVDEHGRWDLAAKLSAVATAAVGASVVVMPASGAVPTEPVSWVADGPSGLAWVAPSESWLHAKLPPPAPVGAAASLSVPVPDAASREPGVAVLPATPLRVTIDVYGATVEGLLLIDDDSATFRPTALGATRHEPGAAFEATVLASADGEWRLRVAPTGELLCGVTAAWSSLDGARTITVRHNPDVVAHAARERSPLSQPDGGDATTTMLSRVRHHEGGER